jgi:hypothetical protein
MRATHPGRARVGLRGGAVGLGVSPAWGRRGGGDDRRALHVGRSARGTAGGGDDGPKGRAGLAGRLAAQSWAAGASGTC